MLVLLQVFNLNERETSEIYVCMCVSMRMREHIVRDSEFIYIFFRLLLFWCIFFRLAVYCFELGQKEKLYKNFSYYP